MPPRLRVRIRVRVRVRVRFRFRVRVSVGLAQPNPNPNPNQAGVADEAELLDLALEIAAQACPAECGGEEVRGPLRALLGELGQLARLQRAAVTLSLDRTLT